MDSSDEFDDDPFSYKPLKRKKMTSPEKVKKRTCTSQKPHQIKAALAGNPKNKSQFGRGAIKRPGTLQSQSSSTATQDLPRVRQTLKDILDKSSSKFNHSQLAKTPDKAPNEVKLQDNRKPDGAPDLLCSPPAPDLFCSPPNTPTRQYTSPVRVVRRTSIRSSPSQQDRVGSQEQGTLAIFNNSQQVQSQVRSSPSQQDRVRVQEQRTSVTTSPCRERVKSQEQVELLMADEEGMSLINSVVEMMDEERPLGKVSKLAGPSRALRDRATVVVGEREVDVSLEPSPVLDVGAENFPVVGLEVQEENPCPIRVSAERDSAELELNLDIDSKVQCTSLRVKVPLKPTDSGRDPPVEVSADYTDIKTTPKKSTSSKEPYSPLNDKENAEGDKKAGSVKEQWDKIFSRAKSKGFLAPDLDSQQRGEKGLFGGKRPASLSTPSGGKRPFLAPDSRGDASTNNNVPKKCPWYKKIKGTTFAVDVFNCGIVEGVSHYILSHYHSDHYMGLSAKWSKPIVASSITKRMAVAFSRAKPDLFITLDPGETRVVAGVELTAVDANHCPGSLMFVMRLVTGTTILHCGDCRAGPGMEEEPVFWNPGVVDTIYLDTTYCRPEYDFPSQGDVIDRTVELVVEFLASHPSTAVLVGAYMIGKERIFKAVARELDCRVWAEPRRVKTWECLGDREILDRRVVDRSKAVVQVVQQRQLHWGGLGQELDKLGSSFRHVLGVKPTGWTHSRSASPEASLASLRVVTRGQVSFLEVPYSEHSSFSELGRLIKFLRIKDVKQIIPTVNLRDMAQMKKTFAQWIEEGRNQGPDSY